MSCVRKQDQISLVLKHLRKYRRRGITSMQAFHDYSITRLSSAIHDLRKRGVEIETELRKSNGTQYAIYRLAK